jgi:hypothetical protein
LRNVNWVGTVHHGLPRQLFHSRRGHPAAISLSSVAFRRKNARIGRSRSPRGAACR